MNNVSLRKLSIIIFMLLVIISSVFAISSIHISKQVSQIQNSWSSFRSQHDEKARLLNSLYAVMGYGGGIHNFKNYLLRKDFDDFIKIVRSMGAVQAVLKQYDALSSSHAEKLALADIQSVLNEYQNNVEVIRAEITAGSQSTQIDLLVKLDDNLALRGLKTLSSEIKAEHSYFKDENNKPVLVAAIRSELGYGGMIHAFKNYILRHDQKYKERALSSITNINEILKKYRNLPNTTSEEAAIEDIIRTLGYYQVNIDLIDQGIQQQLTAEEIDSQVMINDSYALRGLQTLDQEIINQIDKKAEQLTSKLTSVIRQEHKSGALVVGSTLLIALFIFWVFSKRIINPVKKISETMLEMAHGNLDVSIEDQIDNISDKKTELRKMKDSLHVFKKQEIKRRVAEEEIRHLALTDPLTGLANRNQFEIKYREMIALGKREKKSLTLLAIDLDNFKRINDQYGHAAGDLILKSVASKMLLTFRETDLAARLGGDEFLVFLYGADTLEGVVKSVERLLALIPSPVAFGKDMLSVGASIGVAQHTTGNEANLDLFMHNADIALYKAKDLGKNTYSIYRHSKMSKPPKETQSEIS